MATCLGDVMRPDSAVATVRLLRRLGVVVHFPKRQTCCGQPFYNSGFLKGARDLARHTIEVFSEDRPVVVPSGRARRWSRMSFPILFHDDAAWQARATELSARTFELSDFLVNRLKVTGRGGQVRWKSGLSLCLPLARAGPEK